MCKSFGQLMKGVGVGMVLGCAVGVAGTCYLKKNKKCIKKNAGKALHSIGDLLDNVTDMF